MSDQRATNDMDNILFINLISMLGSSAMQQMGKLVNPITQKIEIDLESAQVTIDMLSMIKKKTEGNLDTQENRMLADILSSLQMNYVETSAEAAKEKKSDSADSQPKTPEQEDEKQKFHKSYEDKQKDA